MESLLTRIEATHAQIASTIDAASRDVHTQWHQSKAGIDRVLGATRRNLLALLLSERRLIEALAGEDAPLSDAFRSPKLNPFTGAAAGRHVAFADEERDDGQHDNPTSFQTPARGHNTGGESTAKIQLLLAARTLLADKLADALHSPGVQAHADDAVNSSAVSYSADIQALSVAIRKLQARQSLDSPPRTVSTAAQETPSMLTPAGRTPMSTWSPPTNDLSTFSRGVDAAPPAMHWSLTGDATPPSNALSVDDGVDASTLWQATAATPISHDTAAVRAVAAGVRSLLMPAFDAVAAPVQSVVSKKEDPPHVAVASVFITPALPTRTASAAAAVTGDPVGSGRTDGTLTAPAGMSATAAPVARAFAFMSPDAQPTPAGAATPAGPPQSDAGESVDEDALNRSFELLLAKVGTGARRQGGTPLRSTAAAFTGRDIQPPTPQSSDVSEGVQRVLQEAGCMDASALCGIVDEFMADAPAVVRMEVQPCAVVEASVPPVTQLVPLNAPALAAAVEPMSALEDMELEVVTPPTLEASAAQLEDGHGELRDSIQTARRAIDMLHELASALQDTADAAQTEDDAIMQVSPASASLDEVDVVAPSAGLSFEENVVAPLSVDDASVSTAIIVELVTTSAQQAFQTDDASVPTQVPASDVTPDMDEAASIPIAAVPDVADIPVAEPITATQAPATPERIIRSSSPVIFMSPLEGEPSMVYVDDEHCGSLLLSSASVSPTSQASSDDEPPAAAAAAPVDAARSRRAADLYMSMDAEVDPPGRIDTSSGSSSSSSAGGSVTGPGTIIRRLFREDDSVDADDSRVQMPVPVTPPRVPSPSRTIAVATHASIFAQLPAIEQPFTSDRPRTSRGRSPVIASLPAAASPADGTRSGTLPALRTASPTETGTGGMPLRTRAGTPPRAWYTSALPSRIPAPAVAAASPRTDKRTHVLLPAATALAAVIDASSPVRPNRSWSEQASPDSVTPTRSPAGSGSKPPFVSPSPERAAAMIAAAAAADRIQARVDARIRRSQARVRSTLTPTSPGTITATRHAPSVAQESRASPSNARVRLSPVQPPVARATAPTRSAAPVTASATSPGSAPALGLLGRLRHAGDAAASPPTANVFVRARIGGSVADAVQQLDALTPYSPVRGRASLDVTDPPSGSGGIAYRARRRVGMLSPSPAKRLDM